MDKDKKEMAEYLWLEINKAIVNSQNVKDCLHTLKDMGMIDFLSRHDFILDGKLLIKRILEEPNIRVSEDRPVADSKQKYVDVTKKLIHNFKLSLN